MSTTVGDGGDFWRDLGSRLLDHHGVAVLLWRPDGITMANHVALDLVADPQAPADEHQLLERLAGGLTLPEHAKTLPPGAEVVVDVEIAAHRALLRASAVVVGGMDASGTLALVTFRAPLEESVDPEQVARLEMMLDTTDDIITVIDRDGRIRFSNSAAGRITGLVNAEVNGSPMTEFVHPEDIGAVADAFRRGVIEGKEVDPIDVRIRMADGEWHNTEARLSGGVEIDGAEAHVVAIRDVSDRVRREAENVAHRRRLESIVENIDDIIVILGEDLTVKWASPGIEQVIDAPAYTNVGESAFNDMHPDDVDGAVAALDTAASRPDARAQATFRLRHARFGWRWVDAVVVNRLEDPSVEGLVCTMRDVTDQRDRDAELRRLAEQDRREAESLRAADELKDRFLATVSHELRTPLASVRGFSELLEDQAEDLDDATQAQLVSRISANARSMEALIEQLLDFSRLQADVVRLEIGPLDMAVAVEAMVADLEHQLCNHEVSVDVGAHVVLADEAAFAHVLRNLLTNAARYSNDGTRIEVSAERVGDRVDLRVADHGIGIAPEDRARVFHSFFQAAPGFPQRRGTGIGLSIARRYAQLQSGRVTVESTLGEGSTFTFTLPAAD